MVQKNCLSTFVHNRLKIYKLILHVFLILNFSNMDTYITYVKYANININKDFSDIFGDIITTKFH